MQLGFGVPKSPWGAVRRGGHRLQELEGEIRRKRDWRADAVREKSVWGVGRGGRLGAQGALWTDALSALCSSPISRVWMLWGPGFTFECVPGTSFRPCGQLRESEPQSPSRPRLWSSWLLPRAGRTLGGGTGTGCLFGCLACALGWGTGAAPPHRRRRTWRPVCGRRGELLPSTESWRLTQGCSSERVSSCALPGALSQGPSELPRAGEPSPGLLAAGH